MRGQQNKKSPMVTSYAIKVKNKTPISLNDKHKHMHFALKNKLV